MKIAVQIDSATDSAISANSVLMGLDVLMMTSVVAKKYADWEVAKLNQVRNQVNTYSVYTWNAYVVCF